MDVQVQDLIDRIKKDGVKAAEANAQEITGAAQEKANAIVQDAQKKADDLLKNAKQEIARLEKASEDAIAQASRNVLLDFRASLTKQLDAFLQAQTARAFSNDLLKTLIPEVVKAWQKDAGASGLEVLLNEKDCKALEAAAGGALKEQIAKGLELKNDKTIGAGFRVGVNNGAAFYDYSAEAVSQMFSAYLNPKIASIMKNAIKEN